MNKRTVAVGLIETLEKSGVKNIYGITGDSANLITDAISRSSIRFVHTRHEESAAMAAAAEAAATKRLAVCIGSCGPGSLHMVNGLYEANRNGVPVLALATEIHRSQIGTRYVQEIDTREVFRGCSVFCEYLRGADQLPRLLGIAMQTAISRGGVSVLIITSEVASELMISAEIKYTPFYPQTVITPSHDEIKRIAELVNQAKKVTIFAGSGCRGGETVVKELSKKIKAPIAWSYIGKELFDFDNPYGVGLNGILGNSAAVYSLYNADLILLLGCGFAFPTNYPDNVPIVQIDIHGENLARRHFIEFGAVGDIGHTITALLPMIDEKTDSSFAAKCASKYNGVVKQLLRLAHQNNDSNHKIYPEHLAVAINEKASSDAWITADMGTPWAFTGRYIESLGSRRFFTSSLHGTMANALSSTIGLLASNPKRQVIALCGDGGLSMLMGELITLKQEKLNPKIFVFNNSSLDFVAMEMKGDGLLPSYTNLDNPNFATVAQSCGLMGIRVEKVSELSDAIDQALAYPGAVLVDVVVDPNSLLMPPQITAKMAGNFADYAFKLAEHGEYEELLNEAVTNLRQLKSL